MKIDLALVISISVGILLCNSAKWQPVLCHYVGYIVPVSPVIVQVSIVIFQLSMCLFPGHSMALVSSCLSMINPSMLCNSVGSDSAICPILNPFNFCADKRARPGLTSKYP